MARRTCSISTTPSAKPIAGPTTTRPYTYGALSFPDTPVDFPKNHRSRFGGALGGPLLPKAFLGGKWFFFANYEGLRYPNAQCIQQNRAHGAAAGRRDPGAESTPARTSPINLNPVPVP